MGDAPAATREQGWGRLLLAVAALMLLSRSPGLRMLAPIADPMLIVFPVIAACCVAGWVAGGSPALAAIWVTLTAALFLAPAVGEGGAYRDLARAWGLIFAATFGLVCLLGHARTFVGRAVWTVSLALTVGLTAIAARGATPAEATAVVAVEMAERNAATAAELERWAPTVAPVLPAAGAWASEEASTLHSASGDTTTPFLPALLGLESIAACALAWALYHRLSRARLGPPLAPLRSFSFNDQLIWALVAGVTLAALPSFGLLRVVGWNLTLFFGALYVLRGVGVLASFLPGRTLTAQVASSAAALLLLPVTAPAALGVGVSDTWINWRKPRQ